MLTLVHARSTPNTPDCLQVRQGEESPCDQHNGYHAKGLPESNRHSKEQESRPSERVNPHAVALRAGNVPAGVSQL